MPHRKNARKVARRTECVIFDAEGVVIDTEGVWDHSQHIFLNRRGIAYDRPAIKHLMAGRSLKDGVRVMQERYGFGGDPEKLARERREIFAELIARGEVTIVPGFAEFRREVERLGLKTCIATAMEPGLLAAVDRNLNLRQYFDERIYFTADVGYRAKSDPAVFLHAADRCQSAPAACLVIEDSPGGIAGARAAGMRCVALTTTFDREQLRAADWICDSFAEIPVGELTGEHSAS